MDNAQQAQVYAELAGVNNVVIESTDSYKAMMRNLAFTLSLYSGQMCTTTQDLFVPAGGIETDEGHKSFDQVASDLGAAVGKFLSDPAVATAVLGAIQSPDTLARIDEAAQLAEVVLPSKKIDHPEFPHANVRTPLLLKSDAVNEAVFMQERFGPISFVVKSPDWKAAVALSERAVKEHGALTVGLYSMNQEVVDAMTEATLRAGVSLSINLTGNVYVNQSAAFSDFHATGANPGRERELHRLGVRRQPVPRRAATLARGGLTRPRWRADAVAQPQRRVGTTAALRRRVHSSRKLETTGPLSSRSPLCDAWNSGCHCTPITKLEPVHRTASMTSSAGE